jgi:hypothetical protein
MLHNIYVYLFTEFYQNSRSQFIRDQKSHIYVLLNLKQYILCKAAVTSIVNATIACLIFYFSHFSGLVDHSYVYKFKFLTDSSKSAGLFGTKKNNFSKKLYSEYLISQVSELHLLA